MKSNLLPDKDSLHTFMGSLCSKSDSHSEGHKVLGSADGPSASSSGPRPAPRSAAAEAAEARLKSVRVFPILSKLILRYQIVRCI
jgi:hypothetical protein